MIKDHIKEEHMAGWEFVAGRSGASVEEYAQRILDGHGADFERQRREADRLEQSALFEKALSLSPERRERLKGKLLELLAEEATPSA